MAKSSPKRRSGRQRLKMKPWLQKHLEDKTFSGLKWKDKDAGIFTMSWKHASGKTWDQDSDTLLYKAYATHTGKYKDGQNPDFKKMKANFRCAINSLPDVEEMKSESNKKGQKALKVYRFIHKVKKEVEEPMEETKGDNCRMSTTTSPIQVKEERPPTPCCEELVGISCETKPSTSEENFKKGSDLPHLPIFKCSSSTSGGTVHVMPDKKTINLSITLSHPEKMIINNYARADDSRDGLNSEGEEMTDEDFVEMVDVYKSDYERSDSNGSSSSSPELRPSTDLWNPSILAPPMITPTILMPAVVTEQDTHSMQEDSWELTALQNFS